MKRLHAGAAACPQSRRLRRVQVTLRRLFQGALPEGGLRSGLGPAACGLAVKLPPAEQLARVGVPGLHRDVRGGKAGCAAVLVPGPGLAMDVHAAAPHRLCAAADAWLRPGVLLRSRDVVVFCLLPMRQCAGGCLQVPGWCACMKASASQA